MATFINTYNKGMNKDLSPNHYPNDMYYHMENMRNIADDPDGLTTGSLVNIKGNKLTFSFANNGRVIGSVQLRGELIIFVKDNESGYESKLYKIDSTDILAFTGSQLSTTYVHDGGNLIYKGNLNFQEDNRIYAVSNYESDTVQKVYWVDGLNPLRHLNIIHNEETNNLETDGLTPDMLEILPNHTYGTFDLALQTGGQMRSGRVQYVYQLYSVNGSETMYSPASGMMNLSSKSILTALDKGAGGSEIDENVNKAVQVTINFDSGTSDKFNRVRLVALEYQEFSTIPVCRIVTERSFVSDTVTIIDYGFSLGDITLEEVRFLQREFTPTTIAQKKNYLFVGNITEAIFDVDDLAGSYVDTRTYRSRRIDNGTTGQATGSHQDNWGSADQFNCSESGGNWSLWFPTNVSSETNFQYIQKPLVNYNEPTSGYIKITIDPGGTPDEIWLDVSNTTTYTLTYYTNHPTYGETIRIVGQGVHPSYGPSQEYNDYTGTITTIPGGTRVDYVYTYTISSLEEDCIINKDMSDEFVINISGTESDFMTSIGYIEEDNNCINTYNSVENDDALDSGDNHDHGYKYIPLTATNTNPTIGGKGKIIEYEFVLNTVDLGGDRDVDSGYEVLAPDSNNQGYLDVSTVIDYTGYARDEVYRFGIVFYDLDGRASFPKWIGDVRFPNWQDLMDDGTTSFNPNHTSNEGEALGIKFTIDWTETTLASIKTQLSGFRIVRVRRTDADKTIKATGIGTPIAAMYGANYWSTPGGTSVAAYNTGTTTTIVSDVNGAQCSGKTLKKEVMEILSPTIAYNKSITVSGEDFVEVIGYFDSVNNGSGSSNMASENNKEAFSYTLTLPKIATGTTSGGDKILDAVNRGGLRKSVTSSYIVEPKEDTSANIQIGGISYTPRAHSGTSTSNVGYKGTTLLVNMESAFSSSNMPNVSGDYKLILVNYRTNLGYAQYGGADYNARLASEYVSCGDFVATPASDYSVVDIYSGDTYIGPFNFLKMTTDISPDSSTEYSGQTVLCFYAESGINTYYNLDPLASYLTCNFGINTPFFTNSYSLQEEEENGIVHFPETYPTEIKDLYRYNSAYSSDDQSVNLTPRPFDFNATSLYDYRVLVSDKKVPLEYSDSWLDFKYNNYLDVDGDYGAITRILNHKDRLYFWQPKGVGLITSNERAVVQTQSGEQLTLGSGGVLERYDYIDTGTGTDLHDAIISTDVSIFYYDNTLKQIRKIGENIEATSEVKGLKSYLDEATIPDMLTAYDIENREVLFSQSGLSIIIPTIVFNGFLDTFTGFQTLNNLVLPVRVYMALDGFILSSTDRNAIYVHNYGDYGDFYGVEHDSKFSLIINPKQQYTVRLDILSWMSNLFDSGTPVHDETLSTLQITNTHQDTGVINITPGTNITKRFSKWRINALRDSVSNVGRLRDSYFKADFTYDNSDNYKLIVNDIISEYFSTKL